MKLEIGKVYGGDYYTVDLEESANVDCDPWYRYEYRDVDDWCEQTFGPQDIWGAEPVSGWKRMRNRYFFGGKDKLNLFVLRWS